MEWGVAYVRLPTLPGCFTKVIRPSRTTRPTLDEISATNGKLTMRIPILFLPNLKLLLGVLYAAFAVSGSRAQPRISIKPGPNELAAARIEFSTEKRLTAVVGDQGGTWGYLPPFGGVALDAGERKVAIGLSSIPDYLKRVYWHRQASGMPREKFPLGQDVIIDYPAVGRDDVLPMFGAMYKLTELLTGESAHVGRVKFERLAASEWPTGLVFQSDSFPLFLQRLDRGIARLHNCTLVVHQIRPVDKSTPGAKQAMISVEGDGVPKAQAELVVGDILLIRDRGHKVRSITPRDERSKVVGWVELDVMPIREEKLIEEKTPFVRPKLIREEDPESKLPEKNEKAKRK